MAAPAVAKAPDVCEDLALALVREYLHTRGYKRTLATLGDELPVKPTPTTRQLLTKELGLTRQLARNKRREVPYATLVEVITRGLYDKRVETDAAAGVPAAETAAASTAAAPVPTAAPLAAAAAAPGRSAPVVASRGSLGGPIARTRDEPVGLGGLRPFGAALGRSSESGATSSAPLPAASSRLSSSTSTTAAAPSAAFGAAPSSLSSSSSLSRPSSSLASGPLAPAARGGFASSSSSSSSSSGSSSFAKPVATAAKLPSASAVVSDLAFEDFEDDEPSSSSSSSSSASRFSAAEVKTPTPTAFAPSTAMGRGITGEEAVSLRDVVFGKQEPQGKFPPCWLQQGMHFRSSAECAAAPALSMGLLQNEGGPCGLLAAVQSYIIKHLLFSSSQELSVEAAQGLLSSNGTHMRKLLIAAMAEMLWTAGSGRTARVAVPSTTSRAASPRGYRPDGVTETLTIFELRSLTELTNFIAQHIDTFQRPKGPGAVILLYSLVFSRGIENVQADKDDEWQTLVVPGGYCTQELVNLALTGRAVSNVFDGNQLVDKKQFKGIERKSNIGFLSRFESNGNIQVGNFLKQPVYPIWVVCSESHYSVLWSLSRANVPASATPPAAFDLWYYDELAQQTEEIRLSCDTRDTRPLPKSRDPEPPVNEVIRTKWGATTRIDWNGVDPIL